MKLRSWQSDCIEAAMKKFQSSQNHFMCLATPGAGKTVMASELANKLLINNLVDIVMCFSPSLMVAKDFEYNLEKQTQLNFGGGLASVGVSCCYHRMQTLEAHFWSILDSKRVFVIFDEIHHCSGDGVGPANAWGEQIITNIQGKARYTLALSGTPWRSDNIPIVLANYCNDRHIVHCDYEYGLERAISENVCRLPIITSIDSKKITTNSKSNQNYSSISDLISESSYVYQDVLDHKDMITKIIQTADSRLRTIRKTHIDAAGLIVASSIEHAWTIRNLLKSCNQEATLVTYKEKRPIDIITRFKESEDKWIISVGMISEGTNIPRLRVCCYLSNVKTELYFRQVLGRVMRIHKLPYETALLFMPAHPELIEYANRLKQDIPELMTIKHEKIEDLSLTKKPIVSHESKLVVKSENDDEQEVLVEFAERTKASTILDKNYENLIDSFSRFKQQLIEL